MSNPVTLNSRRTLNLFGGYDLTEDEQKILIQLSLDEMEKPLHKRRTPYNLVREARDIVRFHKWINNK